MKVIIEITAWVFLCVGQWFWGEHFTVYGLMPDFLFAAAICFAAVNGRYKGIVWAFMIGLYTDVIGFGPIGAYALVYTLSAYAVQIITHRFDMHDVLSQAVVVAALSWTAYIVYWIICLIFTKNAFFSAKVFFFVPIFNAVFAPLIFVCISAVNRIFRFRYDYD